ncbi:hypothetical protein Dimus_021934 [Dionaea muscipula]
MGKWNRRFMRFPRSKHYDYQWSPPRETCRDPETVVWLDNVPMWEKKFCYLMGISWERVVGAKNFVHCNSSVLGWDDSAGEEAFHYAKQRFWAKISGLPCENQLPDPDMYIEQVNWNPYIDPELIHDLEREYFNPDEVEKYTTTADDTKQKTTPVPGSGLQERDTEQDDRDNRWNQWESCLSDTRKSSDEHNNPWECQNKQPDGAIKDTPRGDTWGKSSSWKNPVDSNLSKISNPGGGPWRQGSVGKGWHDTNTGVNSWVLKDRETNNKMPVNQNYSNYGGWSRDREASNDRNSSRGQKQWDESRRADKLCTGVMHGSCRKRESSEQYREAGYKGARFHSGFDHQAGRHWRKVSDNKRVNFATQ